MLAVQDKTLNNNRAHEKHNGLTPYNHALSDGGRLVVLAEEIGEVARALTYDEGVVVDLAPPLEYAGDAYRSHIARAALVAARKEVSGR